MSRGHNRAADHISCPQMIAGTVPQWLTDPATEWALFAGIMFTCTWVGGMRGMLLAHLILFVVILRSDSRQIRSQPGGDLDLVFFMGFFPRMVSINLLLTVLIAPLAIFFRKPVLRFADWGDALWKWRWRRPPPKVRPAAAPPRL